MGLYNIVNAASMVAGQPEDVSQVLANFQAIQAILNGGIDDNNIRSTAAINPSKLLGYPSDVTKVLRGDGSWQGNPYCLLIHSVTQTFPSGSTTTTLNFDTERVDASNMHDPVTNNNRITIARAGIYLGLFAAILNCTAGVVGLSYIRMRQNGTSYLDQTVDWAQAQPTAQRVVAVCIFSCAAGDYLDVAYFNGTSVNVTTSASSPSSPVFSAAYIAP